MSMRICFPRQPSFENRLPFRKLLLASLLSSLLAGCAGTTEEGTIASLEGMTIELKDEKIDGGLQKAMEGYKQFLADTPEDALTPEAMRRLADLKIEQEYGTVAGESQPLDAAVPETAPASPVDGGDGKQGSPKNAIATIDESQADFEKRAVTSEKSLPGQEAPLVAPDGSDMSTKGAGEAIVLYKRLLEKFPNYDRNDQVLYQLSRAYEEVGEVEEAMKVMNRLVAQYPNSRYIDEVQFRRGEYFFTRKKYLDAEEAYGAALAFGIGSVYYDRAVYKMGWTFFKQDLYEEALQQFMNLLDYKVTTGYDFDQVADKIEKKRIDDTFRVISLSFSYMGGAESIEQYFRKYRTRPYVDKIYSHLGEFYASKQRYSDAASTYNAFIKLNPYSKVSPHFSMRVIEIYMKGGFPKLVIESKKNFASTYGVKSEYWNYFNKDEYQDVLGYLKTNLQDLANHYHSIYQNPKFKKEKPKNFVEAVHWYREFLDSFPRDEQSPSINYQLADLLLEDKQFLLAAREYEKTAYDYTLNERSPKAAYAAVYAYREHLKSAPPAQINSVKRDIIRASLRLVDTFPNHEKATVVLAAAGEDLFQMGDYEQAITVSHQLISNYPGAEKSLIRGAWLVVAHSSYQTEKYPEAEVAYDQVLKRTQKNDKTYAQLVENLAASIYKQGEIARNEERFMEAVRHFLRIAQSAPTAKIRPSAEYDAAAVLIQVVELDPALGVLLNFRRDYPGHELQFDVTKKIAYVYKELGRYPEAAREYEAIAAEAASLKDEDLEREAMVIAAELYEKVEDTDNSLRVYRNYVAKFPKPVEFALEIHYKIAMIYKDKNDLASYRKTLEYIIATDAAAGAERTERTKYLAAQSALVLVEPDFDAFIAIKLVKPFKTTLGQKQKSMKTVIDKYSGLVDYGVADVTAAATYYIAEIYFNFNRSLVESERPDDLSELELEEFNLMIEETAFPFEEKAITVHEKNVSLLSNGIYSKWIDRSIEKLSVLLPARYAKTEQALDYVAIMNSYNYSNPRYLRDETVTGYIAKLAFFRYASQKQDKAHHENTRQDDNVSVGGAPAADGSVDSAQVSPAAAGAVPAATTDEAAGPGGPAPEGTAEAETDDTAPAAAIGDDAAAVPVDTTPPATADVMPTQDAAAAGESEDTAPQTQPAATGPVSDAAADSEPAATEAPAEATEATAAPLDAAETQAEPMAAPAAPDAATPAEAETTATPDEAAVSETAGDAAAEQIEVEPAPAAAPAEAEETAAPVAQDEMEATPAEPEATTTPVDATEATTAGDAPAAQTEPAPEATAEAPTEADTAMAAEAPAEDGPESPPAETALQELQGDAEPAPETAN